MHFIIMIQIRDGGYKDFIICIIIETCIVKNYDFAYLRLIFIDIVFNDHQE